MAGFTPLSQYADLVLFLARVIVGVTITYYGQFKIRDVKGTIEGFDKIGWKPGWFWGTIATINTFFGGLMILFGILTWLASLLVCVQMILGAIWKITKTDKPFTDWSYNLLLIALLLIFLVFGGGSFSLVT